MPHTEQDESQPLINVAWPYLDHMLREDLNDMLREIGPGLAPADVRPALALFHDPANPGAGVLALLARIIGEIGRALDEQTPSHDAVRAALDQAAAHLTETAGRSIAAALGLLAPPDGR
ncbi:hypothetical protein [Streptomyces sp. NPDC056361]|uniref:hypothetical protein n=1 Tax=Streptomyces sp. NPDC056361 TaxID=3345795 RepID=UPI0035DB993D